MIPLPDRYAPENPRGHRNPGTIFQYRWHESSADSLLHMAQPLLVHLSSLTAGYEDTDLQIRIPFPAGSYLLAAAHTSEVTPEWQKESARFSRHSGHFPFLS